MTTSRHTTVRTFEQCSIKYWEMAQIVAFLEYCIVLISEWSVFSLNGSSSEPKTEWTEMMKSCICLDLNRFLFICSFSMCSTTTTSILRQHRIGFYCEPTLYVMSILSLIISPFYDIILQYIWSCSTITSHSCSGISFQIDFALMFSFIHW